VRSLSWLLAAVLAAALVALYAVDRRQIGHLEARVSALEVASERARDEYETRLATLRAQQARARPEGPPSGGLLAGLLSSPSFMEPQKQQVFRDMVRAVGLDGDQEGRVGAVLRDLAAERRDIAARLDAEGRPLAGSPHADALRRAQAAAVERVRKILTPEQYADFARRGYDRSLGLSAPPS
jgi:hypothetical protein